MLRAMVEGPTLRALVADVGGTKIDFAICEAPLSASSASEISIVRATRVASAEQRSFEAAVIAFLGEEQVEIAVLAVAGPVIGDRAQLTNLPWLIDRAVLEAELGAPVDLINDFSALGYAVPLLGQADLLPLAHAPRRANAPFAVLGAGTGLGEAVFVHSAGTLQMLGSEGGHADFAPRDELELRLFRFLKARFGRVSFERVLSGSGLALLDEFLRSEAEVPGVPTPISPAEVTRRALEQPGTDPIAAQALARWLSIYGSEAGNHALRVMPEGGLYIAGGIAQKLGSRLLGGELMAAFLDKAPMRPVLERIPVDAIMRPDASLLGAFARALVIYKARLSSPLPSRP